MFVSWLSLDWMDICLILKDYCKCAVTDSFCLLICNWSVLCIFLFTSILYLRSFKNYVSSHKTWTGLGQDSTSDAEVSRCTEFTVHVHYPVGCDTNMQDLLFKILQEKKLCAPVLLKSVTLTIDFREWLLKTLWLWDKCNVYVFLFQNLLHSVNNILSTFISLFCKIHT